MTQPAKVQEPSMEEILASIRRIIADDEAKPPPGGDSPPAAASAPPPPAKPEKPAPAAATAPAAKPAAMKDIPPSRIAPAAVRPAPPPPAPPPRPAPAASNSQDDIDALLNGLDESTTEEEVRPPQPDGEVLELTDDMAVETASESSAFHKVDVDDDLEFAESGASKARRPPADNEPPAFDASEAPRPTAILSATTVSAVESAFNTLAHTVLSNNARTLEDLVKEMLRPMLKSWLDDNLPGLVERIVKAEIERVSRGR